MASKLPLVVFSHLRWDFVFQRPQHLLSRLAAERKVIFVEEPIFKLGAPTWIKSSPCHNVLVCRPTTPIQTPGFSDAQMPALQSLLDQLLSEEQHGPAVAWFYTPMALPLLTQVRHETVVYDCMDSLASFLNAPTQLIEREQQLLKQADVVFTGGPSLYRAKLGKHANVHCFSSSVDAKHFGQAAHGIAEDPNQRALPHPRLGYFGVIDERLDLELLDALAVSHPEWQIVMVGPVVKIDEATLPRHANIHYRGQRNYADLPGFLVGWDVCLQPFARNEATRFISPTKTLEYMAAERMIVSTRITDVAEPYGEIVYLADTPGEFVQACEQALAAGDDERQRRIGLMRQVLAVTSWDDTAAKMDAQIEAVGQSRPPHAGRPPADAQALRPSLSSLADEAAPVVVIGAGPTGLSAAYHLGDDAVLLEKNDTVGGWCRSLEVNGFTFDYAGHIMFSKEPYVHELYKLLLKENVHWQDREAWVFSKNVYTRYPFQGALYGLPPQVIKECIMGAIEARFGSPASKPEAPKPAVKSHDGNGNGRPQALSLPKHAGNGHSTNGNGSQKHAGNGNASNGFAASPAANGNGHAQANGAACPKDTVQDCCGDGILESSAPLAASNSGPPKNFEEFIYKVWGAGIAKHFAIPYNKKLWAVPLSEMETSWLGGRVPMPDLEEMIEGALEPVAKPMGPNARFGYPLRGGFQALMDGFLPFVEEQLRLNTGVKCISPEARTVTLTDGTVMPYQHLISTMPLPVLIRSMGAEAPPEVREAAKALRNVSVRCVHIGVGRENLTEKHWIYCPEESVFHRIFVQGNASPHCNPSGGFGLTCEITYSEHKPLPCDGDALIERCIADCRKMGLFSDADPVWATAQVDLPYAYVVYDHARPKNVAIIRDWLAKQDIILAGRYSEWEYYNSDHAFVAGKNAAEQVRGLQQAAAAPEVSTSKTPVHS